MLELNIYILFLISCILALCTLLIIRRLTGSFVTPATAYWAGWIFLLFGAMTAIYNDWIIESSVVFSIDSSIYPYIIQLHLGAFIGYSLGSFFAQRNSSPNNGSNELYLKAVFLTERFTNKILVALLICGLLFLAERIIKAGGLSINYFDQVRDIYNAEKENRSLIEWLGGHLSIIAVLLVIMTGVRDAKDGLNLKDIFKFTLCAAPLGLGNGNRIFLFLYILLYFSSFILCRGNFIKRNIALFHKWELRALTYLTSVNLVLFSVIGFIRKGYGNEFNPFFIILMWPVSTLYAMDNWIYEAINTPNTNGLFTLGWFSNFFNNAQIVDFSREFENINATFNNLTATHSVIMHIPKSIIPDLIFDFGANSVFYAFAILSFIVQVIATRNIGKGVVGHTLAVVCFYMSFMTIQRSLISPLFVTASFWAFIFTLYIKILSPKYVKKLY